MKSKSGFFIYNGDYISNTFLENVHIIISDEHITYVKFLTKLGLRRFQNVW